MPAYASSEMHRQESLDPLTIPSYRQAFLRSPGVVLPEHFALLLNALCHQRAVNPCRRRTGADFAYSPAVLRAGRVLTLNNSTCDFAGLPRWLSGTESTCRRIRHRFDPWLGKIPWRRRQLPTAVVLPGKCFGPRSLAGSSVGSHRFGHD